MSWNEFYARYENLVIYMHGELKNSKIKQDTLFPLLFLTSKLFLTVNSSSLTLTTILGDIRKISVEQALTSRIQFTRDMAIKAVIAVTPPDDTIPLLTDILATTVVNTNFVSGKVKILATLFDVVKSLGIPITEETAMETFNFLEITAQKYLFTVKEVPKLYDLVIEVFSTDLQEQLKKHLFYKYGTLLPLLKISNFAATNYRQIVKSMIQYGKDIQVDVAEKSLELLKSPIYEIRFATLQALIEFDQLKHLEKRNEMVNFIESETCPEIKAELSRNNFELAYSNFSSNIQNFNT